MSITNPRLSRLEAVNIILRGSGEQPVNSLSEDGSNDVSIAEACLTETTAFILLSGGYTNTEVKTYNPDSNGYISLPTGILDVDSTDSTVQVTMRGHNPCRLYNITDGDYVFDEAMELRITYLVQFEDLPPWVQYHIATAAAVQYQMATKGDPSLDAHLRAMAMKAQAVYEQNNANQAQKTLFNNSKVNAYWARNRHLPWRYTWGGSLLNAT